MDTLILPKVSGDMPARDLLDVMMSVARSAVVIENDGELQVVSLDEVIDCLQAHESMTGAPRPLASDIKGGDVLSTTLPSVRGWVRQNNLDRSLTEIFAHVAQDLLLIPDEKQGASPGVTLIPSDLRLGHGENITIDLAVENDVIRALLPPDIEHKALPYENCVIVTRHETQTAVFSRAPGFCECSGNPDHVRRRGECTDGANCRRGDGVMRCN